MTKGISQTDDHRCSLRHGSQLAFSRRFEWFEREVSKKYMRRTKIVCTIGPASQSLQKLKAMMRAGMNAARLNLSHGTYSQHRTLIKTIRFAAKSLRLPIPILADLQGPKIRIGILPGAGVILKANQSVIFSPDGGSDDGKIIPVTYRRLHKDVKPRDRIFIDDGQIELTVTKIVRTKIQARVVSGGKVTSHKGMNFPDSRLSIDSLTQKDEQDVLFALEQGLDWLALSFVKSAKDVRNLQRLIRSGGKSHPVLPRIMVKIETPEAIDAFDSLLLEADAVMIARGDLGVEIPVQELPVQQKRLVSKCRVAGKPVIVATHLLDSMIRQPRPTRAEVSDVANAVFDHTSGVMLSSESAIGKYPVQAVKIMASIIDEAEASPYDDVLVSDDALQDPVVSVAHSLKLSAQQGSIDAVVASVDLAPWSQTVHRLHPEIPLFLGCSTDALARQVSLQWGSRVFVIKKAREQTFALRAIRLLQKQRLVKKGMRLAVILGGRHGKAFDVVTVLKSL